MQSELLTQMYNECVQIYMHVWMYACLVYVPWSIRDFCVAEDVCVSLISQWFKSFSSQWAADRGHNQRHGDIYSSEAYGDSPLHLAVGDYLRTTLQKEENHNDMNVTLERRVSAEKTPNRWWKGWQGGKKMARMRLCYFTVSSGVLINDDSTWEIMPEMDKFLLLFLQSQVSVSVFLSVFLNLHGM